MGRNRLKWQPPKGLTKVCVGIQWDTGAALCTYLEGLVTRGYGTKYVTIPKPLYQPRTTRRVDTVRLNSLPGSKVQFIEPMDCAPVSRLPDDSQWVFEIKLDGYRAIAVKADRGVNLFSRDANPSTIIIQSLSKPLAIYRKARAVALYLACEQAQRLFGGRCVNSARIVLRGTEWHYDPSRKLGKPGDSLGDVFEGASAQGQQVAVKKVKITPIAAALHRELAIVDELVGRDLVHVLPVLDWGQDSERAEYFVIMPRAERSLAEELELRTSPMSTHDAASILLQVAAGLAELPGIVHRDVTPYNVLWHEGKWKITDFGNARLLVTPMPVKIGKEGGNREYAAPEQWLGEHPTHATDVYALGCLAHKLLRGAVPFDGPNYRDGHLNGTPPDVPQADPQLRALISAMLRKKWNVRPSLKRVVAVLNDVVSNPPAGSKSLKRSKGA